MNNGGAGAELATRNSPTPPTGVAAPGAGQHPPSGAGRLERENHNPGAAAGGAASLGVAGAGVQSVRSDRDRRRHPSRSGSARCVPR